MGGAAKIAVRREIFKSTTSVHAAEWEMMPKRTSLRSARAVTERDILIVEYNRRNRDAMPRLLGWRLG
jgi:hypothetical protein